MTASNSQSKNKKCMNICVYFIGIHIHREKQHLTARIREDRKRVKNKQIWKNVTM